MTYETYRSTRHFGSLDGLRCLSILYVIWHHARLEQETGIHLLDRGYHGVQLFFVISGFLITTLLLRERERFGAISYSRFLARRALRIFPLYYVMLGVYLLALHLFQPGSEREALLWDHLPFHLTYLSNWAPKDVFGFAWSLACEEQFYLVWPWLLILLPRMAPWAVLGLWATKVFLFLQVVPGLSAEPFAVTFLRKIPDCILVGVLCAYVLHRPRLFQVAQNLLGRKPCSGLALAGVLVLLASPWHWPELPFTPLAYGCLVMACCIREDHGLAPLIKWRPAVLLGQVSYGMYLMHMLAIGLAQEFCSEHLPGGSSQHFVVVTALTTLMAWISFHFFESWFLNKKRHFAPSGTGTRPS